MAISALPEAEPPWSFSRPSASFKACPFGPLGAGAPGPGPFADVGAVGIAPLGSPKKFDPSIKAETGGGSTPSPVSVASGGTLSVWVSSDPHAGTTPATARTTEAARRGRERRAGWKRVRMGEVFPWVTRKRREGHLP